MFLRHYREFIVGLLIGSSSELLAVYRRDMSASPKIGISSEADKKHDRQATENRSSVGLQLPCTYLLCLFKRLSNLVYYG